MQQLSWPYPFWYLLFCVLLGVAAAVLLYRKDTTFNDQSPWLRYGMSLLRGIVVTLLSALLLAPLLKLLETRTEPPVIILAQDQSTSIMAGQSDADSAAYHQALNNLHDRLSSKFAVHRIGFGETAEPVADWLWDDQASDIGALMTYLRDQYRGQNIGAVIMATDGAFNKGKNPLYVPAELKTTLSVVALGDTVRKTDLQVKEIFHNSIAYLGDRFAIQVDLAAMRLEGQSSAVELRHIDGNQNTLLERIPLNIDTDPWFQTKEFILEATQSGIQRYRVQLTLARNEVTHANNVRDFFVEVIDGRLNVLLLANSPHPDLGAIRNALLGQRNYEVDVKLAAEMNVSDLKGFDLVIFHQLPSIRHSIQSVFAAVREQRLPAIFITGYQTDLDEFNTAQNLLTIDHGGNRAPNEVTMIYNPGFTSFKTTDELKSQLPEFSPLVAPYGEFNPAPGAQILAFQRIGSVDTEFPLILVGETNEVRTAVIAGEGIWKWQLYDQLQHGSKEITQELIGQLVQYASSKSDKRKFRVSSPKKLYSEIEDIVFQAELYNDNFELVNAPEVSMVIRNEAREEFDYTFNTSGDAYHLSIGRYPEGNYTFTASTEFNGVRHTSDGRFVVQPVQLEAITSTADHGVLRQLADQYGGEVVLPANMDALAEQILDAESIKPVLYSSIQTRALIHLKWVCFFLLGVLVLEWFLRRYYGGY